MLKRSITYTNLFTDETVTEDHYFHISKADLIVMEVSQKGGMKKYLEQIIASEDGKSIMEQIESFIHRSYGQKEDNRFVKSSEIWKAFYSSEAYSQLFFELCTDAEKAAAFLNGILPAKLLEEAAKIAQNSEPSEDPTGLTESITPQVLTAAEVHEMDSDELKSGLATGRYKLQ